MERNEQHVIVDEDAMLNYLHEKVSAAILYIQY